MNINVGRTGFYHDDIAGCFERQSQKEFNKSLYNDSGSHLEVEGYLYGAIELKYIAKDNCEVVLCTKHRKLGI